MTLKTKLYFDRLIDKIISGEKLTLQQQKELTTYLLTTQEKKNSQEYKDFERDIKKDLSYTLKNYTNKGYKKFHKLEQYKIHRLDGRFRSEMKDRLYYSFGLVKSRQQESLFNFKADFLNFLDNKELQNKTDLRNIINNDFDKKRLQFIRTDQTNKFLSNLSDITAKNNKALGGIWHTREDSRVRHSHKLRDGEFYFYRNNWAIEKGLIKNASYIDDFDDGIAGTPINCRCWFEYIYSITDVPDDFLTKTGIELKRS